MKIGELLDRFEGMRALVIGDLMLDEYVFGAAARISPEAPVMVIRQTSTDRLPGGAANVAKNLSALGAKTSLIGVTGDDEAAGVLEVALRKQGLDAAHLLRDPSRPTTRKTRVVADHSHQVLRIDSEDDRPISNEVQAQLISSAIALIEGADVVIMSDYLKGCLTEEIAQTVIARCKASKIPVAVNPKPRSLDQYSRATVVSLNRSEAASALGLWNGISTADAKGAAATIREKIGAEILLVTLGESGMVACGPETIRVDAPKVEVYDTAGAGDTVIATVALGIAAAGFEKSVFQLAAETAACVVRHVGVATPSKEDLHRLRNA